MSGACFNTNHCSVPNCHQMGLKGSIPAISSLQCLQPSSNSVTYFFAADNALTPSFFSISYRQTAEWHNYKSYINGYKPFLSLCTFLIEPWFRQLSTSSKSERLDRCICSSCFYCSLFFSRPNLAFQTIAWRVVSADNITSAASPPLYCTYLTQKNS